jgi:hypothetical protein
MNLRGLIKRRLAVHSVGNGVIKPPREPLEGARLTAETSVENWYFVADGGIFELRRNRQKPPA